MWRWIKQFDSLLRGELTALPVLVVRGLEVPVVGLAVVIDVLGMIYGACMGLFAVTGSGNGAMLQIPASMVKVPALYLFTLVVTLPSLYVFNALLGSRLTLTATTRLLICALAVMLAVLASGGPIVAFFSVCTSSYYFMILLNVTVFAIARFFGLGFMLQTLHRMTIARESQHEIPSGSVEVSTSEGMSTPPPITAPQLAEPVWNRRSTRLVFPIWLLVFSLVGSQMGWVLRPFVGHPGAKFEWIAPKESNFVEAVAGAVQHLAAGEWGSPAPRAGWR